MPSKTFHFGPVSDEVLLDLFGHHLVLTALLEASTGILAGVPPDLGAVNAAIEQADDVWIGLLRKYREREW